MDRRGYGLKKRDSHPTVPARNRSRKAPAPALSGPGFRIQTGPRKLETASPVRPASTLPSQAPDTGLFNMAVGIAISLPGRVLERMKSWLSAITAENYPRWRASEAIKPGSRAILTWLGSSGRVGAYLTIGAMLGAAALPGRVFGAGGDYMGSHGVSLQTTLTGVVSDNSAPYWNSYWMNQSGEIWSGADDSVGTIGVKILDSLDQNDHWQYLAKGQIGGVDNFIMFNDTEDKVYIRNATSGVEWGNWTYIDPYPQAFYGLDIDNDEILVYNRAGAPKKIQRFSLTGTHLDDMLLPYPTIAGGNGISINPNDGSIIMNDSNDGYFNVIWFTGTEYSSHETFSYSDGGPGGNGVITDISFDPGSNEVLVSVNDPNAGDPDVIKWYRNKPTPSPTPTPTDYKTPTPTPSVTPSITPIYTPTPSVTPTNPEPTPTPKTLEDKIGIFRPSSGMWAIRGVTRAYFGGSGDTPLYRDYNGDGTGDIAIFRSTSGLWAVKGITRTYFGSSSDEPVTSDYNGDGRLEIGIFRESSGLWAVKGVTRAYFGSTGDAPVPGDYSGGNTSGLAIFRPSSGLWALRGVSRLYFGSSSRHRCPRGLLRRRHAGRRDIPGE